MKLLREYLIAGLLVWLPLWVTLLIIRFIVELLDSTLSLLPVVYRPETLLGIKIPGFGVILSLIVLIGTGVLVKNFVGSWFVGLWESFLSRIPLVRTIYTGVKKVLETLFAPGGQSFRKVLLIEYPHPGSWTLAFQTGNASPVLNAAANENFVSVFVPTTPNPTSGFLLLIPKEKVIEPNITVDEGLKYVISLGVLKSFKNTVKNNT